MTTDRKTQIVALTSGVTEQEAKEALIAEEWDIADAISAIQFAQNEK